MKIRALDVSEANSYIKRILINDPILYNLRIKGEISNFKKHYSGHIYLTLKDDGGVLKAVMFKSNTYSLSFTPSDGMKIMAHGRVSVYEAGGVYQLYIDEMLPDGVGELYLAYEKLKQKLSAKGLFDESHKKTIPKIPQKIGVITASTGAAVHDIINVCSRRFPYAQIILYPAQVQGAGAAQSICCGIEYFNRTKSVDTLIVGRGGGSIEDLWAFNEEMTAYAIYNSEIPIISAVGHEVDFTIADFVADLRAPTPSAAAEIAVPSAEELKNRLYDIDYTLASVINNKIKQKFLYLKSLRLTSPSEIISNNMLRLDNVTRKLETAINTSISSKKELLSTNISKLDALSPLKVMQRGFALPLNSDGSIIHSVSELSQQEEFTLKMKDGQGRCRVIDVKEEK